VGFRDVPPGERDYPDDRRSAREQSEDRGVRASFDAIRARARLKPANVDLLTGEN
jgi:hypothetical protein